MVDRDAARLLVSFGFTALESEIYVFLLRESPATGYRVAQAIGKPAANVYKAIQTLEAKGAVLTERSGNRQARAVPADDLLTRLGREFAAKQAEAQAALKNLGTPPADDRVYELRSASLAWQHARELLTGARTVALLRLPEAGLEGVSTHLLSAASRGVAVVALCLAPAVLEGVELVAPVAPVEGSGSRLEVVVDGVAMLAARLDGDEADGVFSRSRVLVESLHEGLASAIALAAVARRVQEDAGQKRLLRALGTYRGLPGNP